MYFLFSFVIWSFSQYTTTARRNKTRPEVKGNQLILKLFKTETINYKISTAWTTVIDG